MVCWSAIANTIPYLDACHGRLSCIDPHTQGNLFALIISRVSDSLIDLAIYPNSGKVCTICANINLVGALFKSSISPT